MKSEIAHQPIKDLVKKGLFYKETESAIVSKEEELEQDRRVFERYEEKGLISIKTLVMKNPEVRTHQEDEYLQKFLRVKHARIFAEFDRDTIKMFVRRLSVMVYKPGDIVFKKNQNCQSCVFVMEGLLEESAVQLQGERQTAVSPLDMPPFDPDKFIAFKGGCSIAHECFYGTYISKHSVICRETTFAFVLAKKEYAGVIYARRQQEQQ